MRAWSRELLRAGGAAAQDLPAGQVPAAATRRQDPPLRRHLRGCRLFCPPPPASRYALGWAGHAATLPRHRDQFSGQKWLRIALSLFSVWLQHLVTEALVFSLVPDAQQYYCTFSRCLCREAKTLSRAQLWYWLRYGFNQFRVARAHFPNLNILSPKLSLHDVATNKFWAESRSRLWPPAQQSS